MASHNPDPPSRILVDLANRDTGDSSTRAANPASLHAGGGHKDPPARDTQGSTPFVVRQFVEASRRYRRKKRSAASTPCECGHSFWHHGVPDGCYPNDAECDCHRFRPRCAVELHTRRRRQWLGSLRHLLRATPDDKRLGRLPDLGLEHRPDLGSLRRRGGPVPGERLLSRVARGAVAQYVSALFGLPLTGPARTW
jgi:hypothetical protein